MEEVGEVVIPGFRFYPTEEELITFYLKHKIQGTTRLVQDIDRIIPELHIYGFEPWDLSQYAGERSQGEVEQWFFFIPRQEKEARGGRPCRLTNSGYWKATGSPSMVYSWNNRAIGMKRTMVFYSGRAPTGTKTKWKMNEYKAFKEEPSLSSNPTPMLMEEFSLCRVYLKSNSLRTFDRRPTGVMINGQEGIPPGLRTNENQATTSTHPANHPSMLTSLSDQNYNSEDETNNINSQSTTDNFDQTLWEWENHHNWF